MLIHGGMKTSKCLSMYTVMYTAGGNQSGPGSPNRTEDEPQVRLPAEEVEETRAVGPKGMVYPEVPFQIGSHMRVVRHETFLQCLDCIRHTGKVKGAYNFSYLNTQDCRPLNKKRSRSDPLALLCRRLGAPTKLKDPL
eukprot:5427772-Amphidinium_carterae.1